MVWIPYIVILVFGLLTGWFSRGLPRCPWCEVRNKLPRSWVRRDEDIIADRWDD